MHTETHPRSPFLLYLGIFLISASGVMLEVAITRIFSARIWYHYAFVAISIALLGWGLGGLFLHILKQVGLVKSQIGTMVILALACSIGIPASLWVIVRIPVTTHNLSIYFAAAVVPFLFAGMTLALALDHFKPLTSRLYFADLVGASFGAAGITFILTLLGGELTVFSLSLLPLLAALCFLKSEANPKYAAVGVVFIAILAFAFADNRWSVLHIEQGSKGMHQHMRAIPNLQIVRTGWNSYSRIDAVEGFDSPFLARIYIDSDAWTNIVAWDGQLTNLPEGKKWFRYIPFDLVERPKTLIIGPGGGVDVMLSLLANSESVTAVELNPIIIDIVRSYGERTGNIYNRPDVNLVLNEGRNFVSRSPDRFDLIVLGFVDSWASVSSGGLALSENYLYTTEAFADYFAHLTDRGVLVFIRWQTDIPRLVSTTAAMLERRGGSARDVGGYISILLEKKPRTDEPTAMLYMLRKTPFTEQEAMKLKQLSEKNFLVHIPYVTSQAPYSNLFKGEISLHDFYNRFDSRVEPVFDNRPFYFATEKPYGVPGFMLGLLPMVFIPALLFCIIASTVGRIQQIPTFSFIRAIAYFSCLGMGFMLVEISLLQQLILLLGHPIFTLSVILFSLLISCGIGSYVSGHVPAEVLRARIKVVCLGVVLLALVYLSALPPVIRALLPLPLGARILLTAVLIFPTGFLLGMPFPSGLRLIANWDAKGPPLFWGLNGVMSVVGSMLAMFLGIVLGFQMTLGFGGLCYLLAALSLFQKPHAPLQRG